MMWRIKSDENEILNIDVSVASGRVFRIGLLIQGKPPKIGELMKWVVKG
jgi:hypothetical protein